MSKNWPMVKLEEVVTQALRGSEPMTGTAYRQIGVKLWGEGAYERETIDGSQTKYAQLFRAEAGDIIVNKIWARNGSVAVVPESLAGCFGSGEFPMFSPIQQYSIHAGCIGSQKHAASGNSAMKNPEARVARTASSPNSFSLSKSHSHP